MLRILKITLCSFAIFGFFYTVEVFADPMISGTSGEFQEGKTIIITGNNFGSKAHAAPLKWDNFENEINGSVVPTNNGDYSDPSLWGNSLKYGNVTIANSNNRPGSLFCSKHDMDDYYTDLERTAYLKWGGDSVSLNKLYITFWVRFKYGTDYERHQVKLWRLESSNDDLMKFAQYNWGPQDPTHYYQRGTGAGGPASSYGVSLSYQDEAWFQIEFQAKQSSQSVADGSIEVWHSYPMGNRNTIVKVVDLPQLVTRVVPYYWDRVYFGECATNLNHTAVKSGVINYFDNFYIDNSWARVVIGDASSYDACTRREVQIPTAWSDSSITIRANTASLPYGIAYLYVVDENGIHNANGFPISVESSPKWLAEITNRWQSGAISRDDLNRAVYWYINGPVPITDPMGELTEEDMGGTVKLAQPD